MSPFYILKPFLRLLPPMLELLKLLTMPPRDLLLDLPGQQTILENRGRFGKILFQSGGRYDQHGSTLVA